MSFNLPGCWGAITTTEISRLLNLFCMSLQRDPLRLRKAILLIVTIYRLPLLSMKLERIRGAVGWTRVGITNAYWGISLLG